MSYHCDKIILLKKIYPMLSHKIGFTLLTTIVHQVEEKHLFPVDYGPIDRRFKCLNDVTKY